MRKRKIHTQDVRAGFSGRASAATVQGRVPFYKRISMNDSDHGPVRDVVNRLSGYSDREEVSLREIVSSFGHTSFLPVMMSAALLVVSPLSGIPLFSSVCGLTVAFSASQMLFGRDHLWLPDVIMRQTVNATRLNDGVMRLRKGADWLDNHARRRMSFLVRGPMRKVLEAFCIICGALMPFLELVPFSSSILGVAILLFSTALLTRDGLFAAAAVAVVALAAMVPVTVFGAVAS